MNLRPLNDRVVIKRDAKQTTTTGGIILVPETTETPDQGVIVAVGPGRRNDTGHLIPISIKVGDRVIHGKYSGQTVKVEGGELLVMREEDIFAVIA